MVIPFDQRAVGFRVGRARGIDRVGRVEHDADDSPIRRSLVVGDSVLTVSERASSRAASRRWPSAAGPRSRRPPPRRSRSAGYSGAGADGSVCQSPNSFPCGSVQVANQPMLGTAIGSPAEPPSSPTFAAPALMSSTLK